MKALSLFLCLAVLTAAVGGLWPTAATKPSGDQPLAPVYATGSREAESLWAAALLESVREPESRSDAPSAREAFVQALERAEHRAPVYLSLALYNDGPWEAFSAVDLLRRELDRREGRLSPRLAAVAERTAPQDRLTLCLLESLGSRLREFCDSADPDDDMTAFAERFTDGETCRRLCLEAAVAEDPMSAAGWQQLALHGTAGDRMRAVEAWQSIEPENAAAWYAEALLLHAAGEAAAALAAIEAGNDCPHCRFPELELPQEFRATFPEDESLSVVAGRPVTPAALSNLLYLRGQAQPVSDLTAELHQLAAALVEDSPASATVSAQLASELQRFGGRLLTADEATAAQVRHGLAIAQLGAGLEEAISQQSGVARFDFHWQRSTRELSAGLGRWNARARQLLEDRTAILRGQVDLHGEELAAMHKLLSEPRLQPALAARRGDATASARR